VNIHSLLRSHDPTLVQPRLHVMILSSEPAPARRVTLFVASCSGRGSDGHGLDQAVQNPYRSSITGKARGERLSPTKRKSSHVAVTTFVEPVPVLKGYDAGGILATPTSSLPWEVCCLGTNRSLPTASASTSFPHASRSDRCFRRPWATRSLGPRS
jgi:hypothetical protein